MRTLTKSPLAHCFLIRPEDHHTAEKYQQEQQSPPLRVSNAAARTSSHGAGPDGTGLDEVSDRTIQLLSPMESSSKCTLSPVYSTRPSIMALRLQVSKTRASSLGRATLDRDS